MNDPAQATVSIASGTLAVVVGGAALSVAVTLPSGPTPAAVIFPTPAAPQIAVALAANPGPVAVAIGLQPGLPGPAGPSGTGLGWIVLTEAAFLALPTPDPDTIYDVTP